MNPVEGQFQENFLTSFECCISGMASVSLCVMLLESLPWFHWQKRKTDFFKRWRIKCQNANAPVRMPMSDPQCEGMLATYGLLSCAPGKAKCVGKVECCQFGSNSIIARGQWAAKRWNARAEDNAIVWMANAFFAIYGLASC